MLLHRFHRFPVVIFLFPNSPCAQDELCSLLCCAAAIKSAVSLPGHLINGFDWLMPSCLTARRMRPACPLRRLLDAGYRSGTSDDWSKAIWLVVQRQRVTSPEVRVEQSVRPHGYRNNAAAGTSEARRRNKDFVQQELCRRCRKYLPAIGARLIIVIVFGHLLGLMTKCMCE